MGCCVDTTTAGTIVSTTTVVEPGAGALDAVPTSAGDAAALGLLVGVAEGVEVAVATGVEEGADPAVVPDLLEASPPSKETTNDIAVAWIGSEWG
jgi:hypothetical protein